MSVRVGPGAPNSVLAAAKGVVALPVARIHSVQIGRAAPLGRDGIPSAFVKRRLEAPAVIECLGIVGDEQADLTVHGGVDKAVYAYPLASYAAWAKEFPEHIARLISGGFGENLTISSLAEEDLCVGDVHRIGSAVLQVCQPRQPCFKLALHFDDNRLPKAMVRNGRAGWYYRVVEPGSVEAGDEVRLELRPNPEFRFDRLVNIVNFRDASRAELVAMAEMDGLASAWRDAAAGAISDTIERSD